jgi:hypothetical protein
MGIHVCEFCPRGGNPDNWYNHTSSGDVTLAFKSGHIWEMPDMILHYMQDHGYQPPVEFVEDVIFGEVDPAGCFRLQTKSIDPHPPVKVGYLNGPFQTGEIDVTVVAKLEYLMNWANRHGERQQTRSIPVERIFIGTTK